MERLKDCVRRRITAATFTLDLTADMKRREVADLWGEVAEFAASRGWVKDHVWREGSLELVCALLTVCYERLVELLPVELQVKAIASIECPSIRERLIHGLLHQQEAAAAAATSRGAKGR